MWAMLGAAAGCGGEKAATTTDAAAATDGGTLADAGNSADAGSTGDTGSTTPDTGATTPDTGTPDTSTPDADSGQPFCSFALDCVAGCSGATCLEGCKKGLNASAGQTLQPLVQCALELCADATTTIARTTCLMGKCGASLGACANAGFGSGSCVGAAECVGRCAPGALGCQAACLTDASVDGAKAFAPIAACVAGSCNAVAPGERAACIAAQCRDAATPCRALLGDAAVGKGLDCMGVSACRARCPDSLPNKPNDCAGYCEVLTDVVGLAVEATYTSCKSVNCSGVLNKFACWTSKCAGEQAACFGAGGTGSCMDVFKCVASKCEGLGGEPACVAKCLASADAQAKDAWINYEGCFLSHLDSVQAQNAKCVFPYDQATCVDTVAGTFCPNDANACFKP
jgi:hypothetical protein